MTETTEIPAFYCENCDKTHSSGNAYRGNTVCPDCQEPLDHVEESEGYTPRGATTVSYEDITDHGVEN